MFSRISDKKTMVHKLMPEGWSSIDKRAVSQSRRAPLSHHHHFSTIIDSNLIQFNFCNIIISEILCSIICCNIILHIVIKIIKLGTLCKVWNKVYQLVGLEKTLSSMLIFQQSLQILINTVNTVFSPEGNSLNILRQRPMYTASLAGSPGIVNRVK